MMEDPTEKYLQWLKEGRTFQDIRNDLERQGISPEDVSSCIRTIDRLATREAMNKEATHMSVNVKLIGLVFLMLGVGYTGYTYFFGNGAYIIAYGAILFGAALILGGRKGKDQ